MGSINSLTLWLSLAVIGMATPILIHLIRRIRVIDWGAMAILQRVLRRRRKRIRTEDLVVLLLRCLALCLLALALLRPTLLGQAGSWLFGSRRVGMVVAIDASYSMNMGERETRFADAIATARAVLSTLKPGDPVSIVMMGSRPRVAMRPAGYEEKPAMHLLERARPFPEGLQLESSLEAIEELMSGLDTPVRECVIISDAQALTWGQLSDRARELLARITADHEDRRQEVYFVPASGDRNENAAVTRLEFAGGTLRQGATARFVVEVINQGRQPRSHTAVQLKVDDQIVDTRVVHDLPPGGRNIIAFNVPFAASGDRRLTASIDDGALSMDNHRHATTRIPAGIRVLVVEPEPFDHSSPRSETYFLRAALGLKGSGAAVGLQVDVVSPEDLGNRGLSGVDIVVLANSPDISDKAAEDLAAAVRSGCGLALFLGDYTPPTRLNSLLGKTHGLLPAELGQPVRLKPDQELTIEVVDAGHPIGRALAELPPDLLAASHVYGYVPLRVLENARTILRLSNGEPLLVESSVGAGKVLIFGSSADRDWNDLVINPANPVWLHTAVSALTGSGIDARQVGESLRLSMATDAVGSSPTLTGPDGKTQVGRAETVDGQSEIDLGLVESPGFYELRLREDTEPVALAVNVDPAESDVSALEAEMLLAALDGLDIIVITPPADVESIIVTKRVGYEFWRVLLTLGLVALLGQAVLADRFSRRIVLNQQAPSRST